MFNPESNRIGTSIELVPTGTERSLEMEITRGHWRGVGRSHSKASPCQEPLTEKKQGSLENEQQTPDEIYTDLIHQTSLSVLEGQSAKVSFDPAVARALPLYCEHLSTRTPPLDLILDRPPLLSYPRPIRNDWHSFETKFSSDTDADRNTHYSQIPIVGR